MSTVYIPANRAEQWSTLLAKPELHWKTGASAKALAYCWQEAHGFPTEVKAALELNEALRGITLLLALPEHKVDLPGGTRPSQSDIWVLARAKDKLVSMAVEGKVAESFDRTVDECLEDASPGKHQRLKFLRDELGLDDDQELGSIRYQLLHRTASAVIEAKRFCASHAVLLVHSFSPARDWLADYQSFARLFEAEPAVDRVVTVGARGGVSLHLGWVCGDARFLAS